jgi:hypothetical protein
MDPMAFMTRPLVACLLAIAATVATANEVVVNVTPFLKPTTNLDFLNASVGLRVSPVPATGGDSGASASHVLIEGATPTAPDSLLSTSLYTAINLTTGASQDVGMVSFSHPASSRPAGTIQAPIVGVVRRNGSWAVTNPQTPDNTTIGQSGGVGTWNAVTGVLNFNLTRGAQTFTGSASYSAVDLDNVLLAPFTLQSGATRYAFARSNLRRDGNRFNGVLRATDPSVGFDSMLFVIEFINFQDNNSNGVPDIVDPAITAASFQISVGEWNRHPTLGWYLGLGDNWAYSPTIGFFAPRTYPRIYQVHYGWITVIDRLLDNYVWFHHPDPALGWLVLDESLAMFRASGTTPDAWQWLSFLTPPQ